MSRPWMPLYVADYLADTGHLTTSEHGAYLLLIMHYWANKGLPDDDARLARIVRMSAAEWRRSRAILADFFDPGWKHVRIDAELAKAEEISDARRRAAEKKHNKSNASAPANAEQVHTQSQSQPQKKDPEASASGAVAPTTPIYTDSRHELWGEGVPILVGLGLSENSARTNIGRWLRETKDDAQQVLGAIQRARDARAFNPVPWVNKALVTGGPTNAKPQRTVQEAAKDLHERVVARIAEFDAMPGGRGDQGGGNPPRLLSQG